jgi:flagella basal body P-ring formation protein FlgA
MNRLTRIVILGVLSLTMASALARAAEIQMRASARLTAPLVLLGDVADVFASDARQAESLKQTELFPAPAIGGKRFVRLREVQDAMELRGVNLAEHTFSGASQVAVSVEAEQPPVVLRVSRTHGPAEVRRAQQIVASAIVRHLEAQASTKESFTADVELSDEAIRCVLMAGRIDSISGGQTPWLGAQDFVAEVLSSEGRTALAVKAKVSVAPAVVVAVRAVPRGAVIQASDVQLDRSQPVVGKGELATTLEDVVGKEAAQAIAAGRPIDRDAVRQPVLVRKGEVVTVYVRSPGVQVRTAARAKDTGSRGELIAVESLENRKSFLARVSGLQEAEVYARGESAMEASPTP